MPFGNRKEKTKTIAVMGATGAQGGAVVKAFNSLGSDEFQIRAITRNPDSEKAKAIAPLVKEVVKADGDDKKSMIKALKGCYGVFILSNFWEDCDVKHEMETLRTCKKAAKKAGVKHVVLSTLDDSRTFVNDAENKDTWKVLNEELGMYVPHFDGKGEVTREYNDLPCTKLYTCCYMENFLNYGWGPTRESDTEPYTFSFPMPNGKKLALVAVEDIGKCACAIFQDSSLIGKSVGVMSEAVTGEEMAATFEKVCGQPVNYGAIPTDVYASFGFPGAGELANMFRFKAENEEAFLKRREIPESVLSKMGETMKFEDYVTVNKDTWKLEPMAEAEPTEVIVDEKKAVEDEEPKSSFCGGEFISNIKTTLLG